MKKISCSLLALVMAMTLLFSCMNVAAADEKVKLTFWEECPGTVQTPTFMGLLDEFMAENPDIEVEYVGIPWDSAKEKYDVAIASNTTPDVASIHSDWLSEYSLKGAIAPLDELFAAWDEADKFSPASILTSRNFTFDKGLYMLPYTANLPCIWLRTDLLAEKGVATPTNWDEFFAAVEAMTDAANGKYGFTIRGGAGCTGQIQHSLVSYSGIRHFFDENGKCLINNDACVEFLTKWASLYNVYTAASDITAGLGETVSAFDSGVAAMMFHNLGSYGDHIAVLQPDQFEAIPYFTAVDGTKISFGEMASCGYVMFQNTAHPEESWRLIKFLAGKHGISVYNQAIGQLPTRSDVSEEAWLADAPHIKTALEYTSDPEYVNFETTSLPAMSSITSDLIPMFQEMIAGDVTAKEFLDTFASMMEEAYIEAQQIADMVQ